jgi:hypothetical protein
MSQPKVAENWDAPQGDNLNNACSRTPEHEASRTQNITAERLQRVAFSPTPERLPSPVSKQSFNPSPRSSSPHLKANHINVRWVVDVQQLVQNKALRGAAPIHIPGRNMNGEVHRVGELAAQLSELAADDLPPEKGPGALLFCGRKEQKGAQSSQKTKPQRESQVRKLRQLQWVAFRR